MTYLRSRRELKKKSCVQFSTHEQYGRQFNPLNAELNPICHLLALLESATIVVVSRLWLNNEIQMGIKDLSRCF